MESKPAATETSRAVEALISVNVAKLLGDSRLGWQATIHWRVRQVLTGPLPSAVSILQLCDRLQVRLESERGTPDGDLDGLHIQKTHTITGFARQLST